MTKLSVSMTKAEKILGFIYLVVQLTVLPLILTFGNMILGSPMSDAMVNFVFFCLNFLFTAVIFREFLIKNTRIALSRVIPCLMTALKYFGLYWILTMVVSALITVCYPDFFNVNDNSIDQIMEQNPILIALGTVVLVPITEELLYRGLVFQNLYNRNRLAAYVISVAAFAALHVVGYITMYEPLHLALCFLQYLPAGICLAMAYAKANTIWASVLIHMTVNLIGMFSMI